MLPKWLSEIADLTGIHRLQHLESNADEIKEGSYYKDFTEEDLDMLRHANASTDVDILRLQNELAELTEPIKKRIKELTAKKKHTVKNLKEGREERRGRLFVFEDFDSNTRYELDENAEIINTSTINRRQRTTFQMGREQADGTNG